MTEHGIERQEWERRFRAHIAQCAFSPEDEPLDPATAEEVATAELESWTRDDDDWLTTLPEEAAREQMSNWTDDEGGLAP